MKIVDKVIIADPAGDTVDVTASGAIKVDGSAAAQPVTDNGGSLTIDAASLPLPTGAATEATLNDIKTSVQTLDNAISGSEIQADIVAALPSGDNTIGRVKITDGTDVADVLDLANSNPVAVAIVDTNGNQIATFGGGTQYNEGDIDATITGTVSLMEGAGNAVVPLQGTVADGLLVNLGANNDITGTVTANAGTNLNTSALALEATLQSVKTAVEIIDNIVSGSEAQVDIVAPLPAGTNNIGDIDVLSVPAPLNVIGSGLEATALRVTIASDSTGVVSIDDNGSSITVDGTVSVAGVSTAANQATIIGHLDGVEGLLTTIDGDTSNISTKIDTLAGAVSGSEMQVDIVTLPAITATNLDIRDLSETQDSVAIYGSDDGGTTKRIIKTDAGGAIQVDLEVASVSVTSLPNEGQQTMANSISVAIASDQSAITVAQSTASNLKTQAHLIDSTGDSVTDDGNNAIRVNVVAGSTSGTEYTEGDTDASITGIAILVEGAGDTLVPVQGTVADGILVNLGSNNDVTVTGSVTANAGTNLNTSALALETTATAIKNAVELIDNTVSGSELQVDIVASLPAGTNNIGDVDILSVPAPLNVVGSGTEATALRVTIATDSTGVLSIDDNGSSITIDGSVGQSGTWNINNVSGTVSLPTGASTLAEQQTQTTSLQLLDDTVATDGAATPTKGILIAGQDGTNAQTIKTDSDGNLQVDILTTPADVDIRDLTATDVVTVTGGAGQTADVKVTLDSETVQLAASTNNIGDVDVLTLPSIPAGTNNIGDVDIASITAGDNTIGRVKLTDGTDVADILDLANSNPLTVAIVDASGDQISTFGGGTQYTEGDIDASITGTAMLMEVAANTLQPVQGTVADGLLVNLGSNNDVTVTGSVTANAGTNLNTSALALETTASAIKTAVEIIDNAISGTEMQVDVVAALPAGNNNIGDVDVASIAAGNNVIGQVKITDGTDVADVLDLANSNPVVVAIVDGSGDQITTFGGGVQYTEGDVDATITGTTMMMEVGGNTVQPVQGTVADGLLVNLGSNNDVTVTGSVTANAGTNLNTSALALETTASAIKTAVEIIDNAIAGTEMQVDVISTPADMDIRDLVFATDKVDVTGSTLGANSGVDIGDVTINNAGGGSAVNIQDGGNTITVDNGGTFAVQVDGAALTALQLIDDTVATLGTTTYTEAATKGLIIGAVRRDADTTLVDTTNEVTPLQVDANGRLKVEVFSGEALPVTLTSTTITGTVAVTQSGTWDEVGINDSGNSITVDDGGSSLTVDGSVSISGSVDTELPTAAALADDTANPTIPSVGAFPHWYDGSTWDRAKGDATDGLLVNLGANNDITGTVTANAGTNLNTSALALETTASAIKTAVELIDNAVSGSELQVDIVAALPAGTNNIGDVDILSIAAGTNYIGKVRLTDGTTDSDVRDLANSNALNVAIVDASGDQITSFGGGTQYTEGDTDATITGTAMLMEGAGNALVVAQGTAADGLLVNLGSNNDVTITGTVAVTQSGTWDEVGINDSGNSITVDAPVGTPVNVQIGNASISAGVVDETGASAVDALAVGGGTPHDSVDSGNPVKIGFKSASALPTAVASADRANGISDLWGRQLVSHIDPAMQITKAVNVTSTQTGTDVWDPGASAKIAITSVVISSYGTTGGRVILWFGDNADTTYTAGTDQVLLAASFAPSSTVKPGLVFTPATPIFCTTADRELHLTTDAAMSLDITVHGYEFL